VFAFDPRTDFVYDVSVGAHAPLSATVELIRADGSPIRLPAATAIAPGTTGVLRTYRSPFKQADGRERVYVRVSSTGGRTSGGYTLRVTERAEAADAVPRVTLELSLADPANPEAVLGTTATSVPISNLSVLVAYDGRSLVARQAFSLVTGAFAFAAQQFDPPNLSLQLASPQFERAPLPGGQLAGLLFRSLSSFPEQRERLASVQEVRVTTGATLVVRRSTADPGVSRQVRLDAPLQAVLLDGSRSTDGGREVVGRGAPRTSGLNYHWTQVGPTPALVALAGARTATPSFQPAVEGPYRFRLVVDNEVLSSPPEEVEIVVRFEHLEPSAAVLARVRGSAKGAGVFVSSQDSGSSTGPLPVAVPATVDLDGSGSVDPDRSGAAGLRYRWTQTAGPPIDLSSPGSVLSTFVSVAVPVASAGLYAFQLVTEDADGLPSRPTMVQLSAAALARPGPMLALSAQTSGGSPEPDLGETPLLSQAEGLRTVLDATTGFQTEIRNRRSTGLSAVAPALVTAGPPSLPGSDGGGGLPLSGSSFGQTPA
jgi:hypothetical protein